MPIEPEVQTTEMTYKPPPINPPKPPEGPHQPPRLRGELERGRQKRT